MFDHILLYTPVPQPYSARVFFWATATTLTHRGADGVRQGCKWIRDIDSVSSFIFVESYFFKDVCFCLGFFLRVNNALWMNTF